MQNIKFIAHFGNELKTVEISQIHLGPRGFHIYIDNYYCGNLSHIRGEWVLHTNNHGLQWSDIMVLGEIVNENYL